MRGSYVVHRSNVTGEINGYAQGFCKQNQTFIPILHIKSLALIFYLHLKA